MRKHLWMAAVGVVGALVVARCRHHAPASHGPDHPELRPTAAAAFAYRFPVDAPDSEDAASDAKSIEILEQRDRDMIGSPFESAELADIYDRRGQRTGSRTDYEAAERYALKSLAILRHPNGALLTLAKVRAARHRFDDAIALAHEQLAHKPSAGAWELVATAQLALGRLPEAEEAARRAIETRPNSSGYTTRALIEEARGEDAAAAADFARAAKSEQPGREGAAKLRALWARFLIRRGELAAARGIVDEALFVAPDQPLALGQRGELELRSGDRAAAAKDFERAFGESRQVRYLIDEARAEGLPKALLDQVEVIVRGELDDGGFGHALDLIEVLNDRATPADLAEAVTLGRVEVERRGSWEVRYQLARALVKTGQLDEADTQLRTILATGAHEAQVFALAAEVATRRGDTARAAELTRAADDVDPMNTGWRL